MYRINFAATRCTASSRVEVLLTTGFCLLLNRPTPRQDKVWRDGERDGEVPPILPRLVHARVSALMSHVAGHSFMQLRQYGVFPRRVFHDLVHYG